MNGNPYNSNPYKTDVREIRNEHDAHRALLRTARPDVDAMVRRDFETASAIARLRGTYDGVY